MEDGGGGRTGLAGAEPGGGTPPEAGGGPTPGVSVPGRGGAGAPSAAPFGFGSFQGYPVDRVLSSAGGEADIYVIRDGKGREYVLRLFRQGREPKPEVFGRLVELSSKLGAAMCQTYSTGRDERTSRWYEIQEYMPLGDLAGLLSAGRLGAASFRELARQLAAALDALHREGVVHRDVKPDNILLRSREPLAAALADFGISSLLAPGVSVKGTGAANTPLYSAPESYADFAGAAGDFWSLGAVLLEAALGRHPLAGLSVNHVMREISLRGLQVPGEILPPEADLLKGLLTRDDRRRWGAREVALWVAGAGGIEVFYEEPGGRAGQGGGGAPPRGGAAGAPGPYRFRGKECRSSAELAEVFDSSEENWAQGRVHLMRGYVRAHMEETGRAEGARLLSRIEGMGLGPDESLFAFIQNFRAKARHAWRGIPLSRMRILELLDGSPASGDGGAGGSGAGWRGAGAPGPGRGGGGAAGSGASGLYLEEILSGRLSALPGIARKAGNPFDRTMEALLAFGAPVSRETLRSGLDASLNPEAFVWGLREPPAAGQDALLFALHAGSPLLSWSRFWTLVPRKAVLPREICLNLSEPRTYEEGLRSLALLASSGALKSGVGKDEPDLEPWKAAGGRVRLSRSTAEDFLDEAEAMKERASELAAWRFPPGGGDPGGGRGGPAGGAAGGGSGRGPAGGGAGTGGPGGGDARSGRHEEAAEGPGLRPPGGAREGGPEGAAGPGPEGPREAGGPGGGRPAGPAPGPLGRAEAWLRRELEPFRGPRLAACNTVPLALWAVLTAWYLLLSGVFGDGADGIGHMSFAPRGIANYVISLAGTAGGFWLLSGEFRRRLGVTGFSAAVTLMSVLFLFPRSFGFYRLKATAVYLMGMYLVNRLRHRLREAAWRAGR